MVHVEEIIRHTNTVLKNKSLPLLPNNYHSLVKFMEGWVFFVFEIYHLSLPTNFVFAKIY